MIEIIKEGTKKIATCTRCGCVYSYENEDIKTHDDIEYTLGSRYDYVNCPQCNKQFILSGMLKRV